jgi:hypothetical protein
MKKGDKLIAVLGVIILIIAAIGIYYWVEEEPAKAVANVKDLFKVSSEFSMRPEAITVSDNCPFYALVATPLAVNYDEDGTQYLRPLYVEKPGEVSDAVTKAESQIGFKPINEISDLSAEEFSLYIAEKYWESSDAVLIIKNNETGYSLGVAAVPIASYLSIPVIVTDEVDSDVREVLENLGVTTSLVCGEIEGYKDTLKFEDIDEIIDASIEIIWERLKHDVEYITLTNPRDAWPPEVLDSEVILSEKGTINSGVIFPSNFFKAIQAAMISPKTYTFEIPDYETKYALIKLDFRNLQDSKHIEKFGDNVLFKSSLTGYIRTLAYPGKRDANGDLMEDRLYFETVTFDSGGEKHSISPVGIFHVLDSAEFELTVSAEELSNPYFPMMKQFSSIAPYLTACREGIILAKPEFAFAPTDDVKFNGKTLPGNTQPFYNPALIPVINQHVYENIHKPLNNLISKLREIDITETVKFLKEDCYQNPLYIALVGDTIMLPHYYYRSPHSDPFKKAPKGAYGTNCPSDFIYGNIDPELYSLLPYDSDHLENDLWSDFPEAENVVGRITGWDVQDASALIARSIFYDKIIEKKGEWKDNAAILVGAGTEVQRIPILNAIHNALGRSDPMKFPSGEKRFLIERVKNNFEKGGFNALSAQRAAAQRVGFTTEALREIKTDGLLNRLFFPWLRVKFRQGLQNIESLLSPEWWVETLLGDSSELVIGGQLEQNSNIIISDSHAIWFEKEHGDYMLDSLGGPFYELLGHYIPLLPLRTTLSSNGAYSVRDVPAMDMGPSVMLVEGCGSGKIDGFIPQNSLANAYLHAGVNAYVSPTTFSAFYGALEPRPKWPLLPDGVGFGIVGYLKAWLDWKLKGQYPPVCFNQFIFEETILDLAENDVSFGTALRNAKNLFLPETFEDTFRWRPVLNLPSDMPYYLAEEIDDAFGSAAGGGSDNFPVEKYCTVFQVNLLGDPAFNPYEPCNEGK